MMMLTSLGCSATMSVRESRRTPVDDGAGSLEETRRKLEGSWSLVSLEVVDASGNRRPVKASGQLTYDAFGNMTVRGVIDDPAMRDAIVLDFDGRIVIDTRRREFRAADITPERPIDQDLTAAISPDKLRHYELTLDFRRDMLTRRESHGLARWQRSAKAAGSRPV